MHRRVDRRRQRRSHAEIVAISRWTLWSSSITLGAFTGWLAALLSGFVPPAAGSVSGAILGVFFGVILFVFYRPITPKIAPQQADHPRQFLTQLQGEDF